MSSAKWHPMEGEFGIFGDVAPGSREDRAAKAQAGKGLEALEEYETKVTGRRGDIESYYGGQQALTEQGYGVQRAGVEAQESQALTQFLGDSYSFRTQSDVQRATSGLARAGTQERGIERRQATMGDLMRGQQEQSSLQMQGLDIAEAKDISDLLKSRGMELSGVDDLLYQLETERISYEGV